MNLNKIILFTLIIGTLFIVPVFIYRAGAVSGACSWHDGINCFAGRDYDGSVVCNDGWSGSATSYEFTEMCKTESFSFCFTPFMTSCIDEDDYQNKEGQCASQRAIDARAGLLGSPRASGAQCQTELAQCRQQINDYKTGWDNYYKCKDDEWKEKQNKQTELSQNQFCWSNYGAFSFFEKETNRCACQDNFVVDPKNNHCVMGLIFCLEYSNGSDTFDEKTDTCVKKEITPIPANNNVLGEKTSTNPLFLQNGWLIKNKKYAEVFSVDNNLCLHWIINEKVALKNFGITWNYEGNIKEFDAIPGGYKFCDALK